ncbi:class I SAM-dependent methyltransferase [Candidatus Saccharibacteria bacterium]|nr:class I SAM-dependent methyltransferase [Candidatus Saccharibacteria bacterium]
MNLILIIVFICVLIFGLAAFTGAPYVPSHKKELQIAFKKLYRLSPQDYIVDLGAGDGMVLKVASEFGAKGLGIEINPLLVMIAKWRLRKDPNMEVKFGNLFATELPSETSLIYVFGESRDITKMVDVALRHTRRYHKTVYLMSYGFTVPGLKVFKKNRALYLYQIKDESI